MKAQLSVALLSGFIGAKLNFMVENFPLTVFGTEGDKTRTRGGIFVPVHYLSF